MTSARRDMLRSLSAPEFETTLAAAASGHGWAFEQIWSRYAGQVEGYLRGQGATDPAGLTSDVFLAVFDQVDRFHGDESGFRSLMFTIAHRRLIDERRRRARRPDTQAMEQPPERPDPSSWGAESEALDRLGTEAVVALLARLAPDQRDVLLLRFVGDMTIEQIAQALGKSTGAVKALQRRGLRSAAGLIPPPRPSVRL